MWPVFVNSERTKNFIKPNFIVVVKNTFRFLSMKETIPRPDVLAFVITVWDTIRRNGYCVLGRPNGALF